VRQAEDQWGTAERGELLEREAVSIKVTAVAPQLTVPDPSGGDVGFAL
jgi:hypothetical protein